MNPSGVLCLALVVGFAGGCQKREPAPNGRAGTIEQSSSMAPPSPRGPVGPVSEAATNPTVINDTGDVNATLQQLTRELRDYVVRSRSVPKNFEEFASKSGVQFPPAPAGKRYAIEGQEVVLSKR